MVLAYFLTMVKKQNQRDQNENDRLNYKNKIKRVSNKIDVWHNRMKERKRGTFNSDKDFIEVGNSPSRFCSSDEDDET